VSIWRRFVRRGEDSQDSLFPACLLFHLETHAMRFMIMVKATPTTETGAMPEDALVGAMATYHEELAKAGVLLDAAGLHPSSRGWRVRYEAGRRTVIDGPFAEAKELIAGYTLIQVRSRDEAMEWARRFPAPMGEGESGEIEVRQLYELDEFEGESIKRFRDLEAARGQAGASEQSR
jgi:hypothetical protein